MKRLFALVALVVLIALSIASASAEENKSGGVTITPAFQELAINSDQQELAGSFSLQNNSEQPATYTLSTIDMGALDDTGGLVFSGLTQDYHKKYGLAEWVELPKTKIEVAPGKVANVAFKIKNQDSLSPGGHYGAIIVKQLSEQSSDKQVAISPQAASLVFLLKRGGEKYGLSLPNIKSDHSIWSLPTKVELPFKNEGNVHVVPRGVVRIKNTGGDEIGRAIINPESSYILPEHTRTFQVTFDNLPKVIWPGRYTIEAEYRYDGQENFTRFSQTFYTANLRVLLLLVVVLIILLSIAYKFRKQIKKIVTLAWRFSRSLTSKFSKRKH